MNLLNAGEFQDTQSQQETVYKLHRKRKQFKATKCNLPAWEVPKKALFTQIPAGNFLLDEYSLPLYECDLLKHGQCYICITMEFNYLVHFTVY